MSNELRREATKKKAKYLGLEVAAVVCVMPMHCYDHRAQNHYQ